MAGHAVMKKLTPVLFVDEIEPGGSVVTFALTQ
jgi:hypothetical protein